MLVGVLEAAPYVDYPKFETRWPLQGVVLLTGANGAGKSTVYEMLAWCLYGQTVRGAGVKDAAVKVTVEERGETYVVERSKGKRGSAKLTFKCGAIDLTMATPTETQLKIDETFGSFEQFCSGRVFARDLLAKFALATDKERKGLLEELLGLQRFDAALKLAKEDQAKLDVELRTADALIPSFASALESFKKTRDGLSHKVALPLEQLEPALIERKERRLQLSQQLDFDVGRKLARLAGQREGLQRQWLAASEAHKQDKSTVAGLQLRLERLRDETHCAHCGREYDAVSREESIIATEQLLEAAQAALVLHESEYVKLGLSVGLMAEECGEVKEQQDEMRRDHAELVGEIANLEYEIGLAKSLAGQQQSAEEAVLRGEQALAEATSKRDRLREQKAQADQVCEVLGLRGARCLLLDKALKRLCYEANLFLAQVHPELRVKLPWTGKDDDKVGVEVTGAGGGDYRACSGGQRVLVDVALVVGMTALRSNDGLMVFDEVFDSLDAQRVELVGHYLQQVARERQVLVISHNENLSQLLKPARRWRAVKDEDGLARLEDA